MSTLVRSVFAAVRLNCFYHVLQKFPSKSPTAERFKHDLRVLARSTDLALYRHAEEQMKAIWDGTRLWKRLKENTIDCEEAKLYWLGAVDRQPLGPFGYWVNMTNNPAEGYNHIIKSNVSCDKDLADFVRECAESFVPQESEKHDNFETRMIIESETWKRALAAQKIVNREEMRKHKSRYFVFKLADDSFKCGNYLAHPGLTYSGEEFYQFMGNFAVCEFNLPICDNFSSGRCSCGDFSRTGCCHHLLCVFMLRDGSTAGFDGKRKVPSPDRNNAGRPRTKATRARELSVLTEFPPQPLNELNLLEDDPDDNEAPIDTPTNQVFEREEEGNDLNPVPTAPTVFLEQTETHNVQDVTLHRAGPMTRRRAARH
jgi:hypothetical protein